MTVLKFTAVASAIALAAGAVPAAAAITTFATFSALNSNDNVYFLNSGNSSVRTTDGSFYTIASKNSTTPGTVDVRFSLLQTPIAAYVTDVVAAFTLNATVSPYSPATGTAATGFTQPNLFGSFSFLTTSAITVGGPDFAPHTYAAGSNLLSGTFTDGTITGSGSSGSGSDSNLRPGATVTFSSDFLDFTPTIQRDLSLAITSIYPSLSKHVGPNGALAKFRANMGGQFSSDPAPVVNGLAIVPEPGMWVLMVAGFGLVGVSSRRRGRAVAA